MRAVAFFEGPSSKVSAIIGFSGSMSYACTTGLEECVGSGASVGSSVDTRSGVGEAIGMSVASGVCISTIGISSNPRAGTMTENAEQPQRDASVINTNTMQKVFFICKMLLFWDIFLSSSTFDIIIVLPINESQSV